MIHGKINKIPHFQFLGRFLILFAVDNVVVVALVMYDQSPFKKREKAVKFIQYLSLTAFPLFRFQFMLEIFIVFTYFDYLFLSVSNSSV